MPAFFFFLVYFFFFFSPLFCSVCVRKGTLHTLVLAIAAGVGVNVKVVYIFWHQHNFHIVTLCSAMVYVYVRMSLKTPSMWFKRTLLYQNTENEISTVCSRTLTSSSFPSRFVLLVEVFSQHWWWVFYVIDSINSNFQPSHGERLTYPRQVLYVDVAVRMGDSRGLENQILEAIVSLSWVKF
jgi:hypothetical protein